VSPVRSYSVWFKAEALPNSFCARLWVKTILLRLQMKLAFFTLQQLDIKHIGKSGIGAGYAIKINAILNYILMLLIKPIVWKRTEGCAFS
jgi:hypothetical protein